MGAAVKKAATTVRFVAKRAAAVKSATTTVKVAATAMRMSAATAVRPVRRSASSDRTKGRAEGDDGR